MQTIKTPHTREDRNVSSILETVEVETGRRAALREFDDTIEAPNWTKDGKYLVFNRNGRIYRYDLAAGTDAEIASGFVDDCNNDHVLSPDGSSIAVSHHTFEDGQSRIYILPLENRPLPSGEPVLVTPLAPSYLHGWSPDGKTLAYCAERDGQYDIYAIPARGGRETRLTAGAQNSLNDGPEYAPDGRHIWFNSTRSGLMQIWRMGADGSNQTQMTFDEANNWFAHVSPDGEKVAFITYKKGDVRPNEHPANKNVRIRLMSSRGGDIETLAEVFGGQGTMNVNSWSPDGKRIAFVSYRMKS